MHFSRPSAGPQRQFTKLMETVKAGLSLPIEHGHPRRRRAHRVACYPQRRTTGTTTRPPPPDPARAAPGVPRRFRRTGRGRRRGRVAPTRRATPGREAARFPGRPTCRPRVPVRDARTLRAGIRGLQIGTHPTLRDTDLDTAPRIAVHLDADPHRRHLTRCAKQAAQRPGVHLDAGASTGVQVPPRTQDHGLASAERRAPTSWAPCRRSWASPAGPGWCRTPTARGTACRPHPTPGRR
jgi:hypothetical protein